MVARGRVLLLEGRLVLLVDDEQPELTEGQEDAAAHAHHDVAGLVGEHASVELHALTVGVARVIDAQPVAEHASQPFGELGGQHYLGQHEEHLLALLDGLLHEVDVYLRLAAARHAVEQTDAVLLPLLLDAVHSLLLHVGERKASPCIRGVACILRRECLCSGGLLPFRRRTFLQRSRQGCLVDVAQGAEVVVGYPAPELQLGGLYDRRFVGHLEDALGGVGRLLVVQAHHDARVGLGVPQGHHHTAAHLRQHRALGLQLVGECLPQGEGQYDVNVSWHKCLQSYNFLCTRTYICAQ